MKTEFKNLAYLYWLKAENKVLRLKCFFYKNLLKFIKYLRKLTGKTRYFIIYYTADHNKGGHVVGQMTVTISGLHPFVNREQMVDFIGKQNKLMTNIMLSGFNELKRADYLKYIADFNDDEK